MVSTLEATEDEQENNRPRWTGTLPGRTTAQRIRWETAARTPCQHHRTRTIRGPTAVECPQERRQKILAVLDSRHAIPDDAKVMRKAGKLSGELITSGQEIDREDCIIAATALLHDEPIVTRNVDHFERIDGLDVRTY